MTNHVDEDGPVDLRALSPVLDGDETAFVAGVMSRVQELDAADRPSVDPLWGIWSMATQLAIVAVAVLALLVAAWIWERLDASRGPTTIADSIGIPEEFQMMSRTGGGR